MRKIRLAMISIGVVIFTGLLLLGGLYLYAVQGSIPRGTIVAGLPLGGRQSADALRLLDEEIAQVLKKKVILSAGESEKTLAWRETGISFETHSFHAAVRQLETGTLWERVQARRNFPKQWDLKIALDEKKLQSVFPPSWEKAQFGDPVDAVRTITPDDQIRYLPEKTALRVDWERLAPQVVKAAEAEWNRRLVERGSQSPEMGPVRKTGMSPVRKAMASMPPAKITRPGDLPALMLQSASASRCVRFSRRLRSKS